jgi:hypothetical protein
LSRYYPKEVNIYSFDNGLKKDKRRDNWEQIARLLAKKDFTLTANEYEPLFNQAPDAAYKFLCRLYEFLTKKQLKLDKRVKATGTVGGAQPAEEIPTYARPTANILAKDRELVRIVDEDEKRRRTELTIE